MKWNKLKDKMPKENSIVLVYLTNLIKEFNNPEMVAMDSRTEQNGVVDFRAHHSRYGTVSHWMDLPKPPPKDELAEDFTPYPGG